MADTDDITAKVTLRDGIKAPRYIFGTGGISTSTPIHTALSLGYRAFDTAQQYTNESHLGFSLRSYPNFNPSSSPSSFPSSSPTPTPIPRDRLFIISKIDKPGADIKATYEGIKKSVEDIGMGYVDLMLVHNPNYGVEGRKIQWGALEMAKREGLVKSIGVSNFTLHHLEGMKEYATELPSVNQTELHPWHQDRAVAEWCCKNGVTLQAVCPLARGLKQDDPVLTAIAREVRQPWNRVLLRYSWQKKYMVICKSENPSRITDNTQIFDFALSDDQMKRLDALDGGFKVTPSSLKTPGERQRYYEDMP